MVRGSSVTYCRCYAMTSLVVLALCLTQSAKIVRNECKADLEMPIVDVVQAFRKTWTQRKEELSLRTADIGIRTPS